MAAGMGFLLTRPLRDVTEKLTVTPIVLEFLLTRPLRDVTYIIPGNELIPEFLLTLPLRDVTYVPLLLRIMQKISTHTPLTGRDGNT